MDEFRLICRHDQWYTPGIDWGYGVGSNVTLIARSEDRAIIKITGAANWHGVALSPRYSPTRYMLVRFIDHDWVKVIKEISPGHKWRSALAALKEELTHGNP